METPVGPVPRVGTRLTRADRLGAVKVRWDLGRMHYRVDPGLYAVGDPVESSPVLVTANYKLSFDRLRRVLPGRNAWILVLDTRGINVWCAAGKGTFGTRELVERIASSGLDRVVSHREVILPQLAAPGVAAHQVRRLSGFRVVYGPIRAEDLPSFLDAGLKASPGMRRKGFPLGERAVLIPVELVAAMKWTLAALPLVFVLGGLGGGEGFLANALDHGIFAVIALLGAVLAGAVVTPLLLPWLPGRAFSLKGMVMGLVYAGALFLLRAGDLGKGAALVETAAWGLIAVAVAAYLAMNFTGASTYTSLSGVSKEMRWAVPLEIGAGCVGLCLWIGSRFLSI
ncbi:MAG: acetyl-CoA synthase subunit gamma [Deltaproteobacteria bacterium]|nr:acetyl-CoA synthase subunit gamma [Deltaproteobacteria bacterium]